MKIEDYPEGLDPECYQLCEAINLLPGIRTIESCCGHGKHPFRIWFETEGLEYLPHALYYFAWCHCGFRGWTVIAQTDCAMSPVMFMIEGPCGEEAYKQANKIASILEKSIEKK